MSSLYLLATAISSTELCASGKWGTTIQSICSDTGHHNPYCYYCFANRKSPNSHDLSKVNILNFLFQLDNDPVFNFHYSCHAEISTRTRREPGLIAYVSGFIIALMGYVRLLNFIANKFIKTCVNVWFKFQMLAGMLLDSMLYR